MAEPAPVTADDHAIAAQLAEAAGKLLMELRKSNAARGIVGRPLGKQGDAASHEFLMKELARLRPEDGVLSEEGAADPSRLAAPRVWIVDPLDGTREFGDPPRDDWAVHVALVVDGVPAAGSVALPARNLTLSTPTPIGSGPGYWRVSTNSQGQNDPEQGVRVVVSRSRPPAEAERIVQELGGQLLQLGSAGAKAMAVVLGEADIYAHSGGQYEWDSAAPAAVAIAAGLHASRLDGSPLVYNQSNPWLPDLLICRPELANAVINAARS